MKFSRLLLVGLFAGSLLGGCKGKDGDPGPAGAAGATGTPGTPGPSLTGTLYGFVSPVDEYGVAAAKSGVTVTLDGVSPAATATTNADGRYEFAALRTGTYNLTFTRAGLTTVRRLGVAHVGGDQPTFLGTNTISAPSTTSFGNVSLNSQNNNSVQLYIPYANAGASNNTFTRFIIYGSANPGTTAANGILLSFPGSVSSPFTTSLFKSTLNGSGFATGTRVYVVVYATPAFLTGFTDPLTGRFVYSGLSTPSNEISFIVP